MARWTSVHEKGERSAWTAFCSGTVPLLPDLDPCDHQLWQSCRPSL